jgi:hypothetical protein
VTSRSAASSNSETRVLFITRSQDPTVGHTGMQKPSGVRVFSLNIDLESLDLGSELGIRCITG